MYDISALILCANQRARWTLPERRQRVQTLTRLTSPSTTARTRWMFGFQERFVFRWEWLTLLPDSSPFAQNSQTFAMCYTSFILRGMMTPKHNISILPQITGPCKYFCLTGSKPSTYLQQSKKCPIGTISLMPMGQDVLSSLSRADDLLCVFLGDWLVAGEGERVAAAALGQGAKLRREAVEL